MSDENNEASEQAEEPTQKVINLNINDARIAEAKEKFKDVDAYKDLEGAKKAKKVLTKMRTTVADAHKREKKQILVDGRRLDGEKNRLLALIAEVETPISDQLTEIKEKAEREETDRVEKIENEIARIRAFANDRYDLTLGELNERRATLALIEITEEFFQEFTEQAQTFKDEAEAKLRICVVNEQERLDEQAKQDKIAEENAAKQRELDDRQAAMDAQDEERKAEQRKVDDAAAEKLATENAERQAELDKVAEEQAAERKKIDDENARIAQEAADKVAEEEKRISDELAETTRLDAAPDVEKLETFAARIEWLAKDQPTMQTEEGSYAMIQVRDDLAATVATLRRLIGEMK